MCCPLKTHSFTATAMTARRIVCKVICAFTCASRCSFSRALTSSTLYIKPHNFIKNTEGTNLQVSGRWLYFVSVVSRSVAAVVLISLKIPSIKSRNSPGVGVKLMGSFSMKSSICLMKLLESDAGAGVVETWRLL